ncbi:FtsK/SpoIIIE domain-containing protein [Streptomyces iranensis]|uniref:Cell division FtsK/SpoIIIE n=1 Tax=Streptomyces iranensis TaxID=576784 RepID=A0A061A131_9ACTN|nr:FtsK/SpoIIIE domain-containing protein [Streptomyces iranensis]MBP2061711.1 S-DNA-T family DNA segregation ATPase FtsK/SpoIIIE [Streptomyces iranensis]CDR09463.1 cell division FtsK/SpoIIIE [Streptomyces iranensis]
MPWELVVWLLLLLAFLTQARWEHRLPTMPRGLRRLGALPWRWYLGGFPSAVFRMRFTWRRFTRNADLAVQRQPPRALVGRELIVTGRAVRMIPPRLGLPRPTRDGLVARVQLHPGQTPIPYIEAAPAMAHAWRMHSVRVVSFRRGEVTITATWRDPLTDAGTEPKRFPGRILAAQVGRTELGMGWTLDMRQVPHWLVVGATQSGKSTLLASLVAELAPQPVALVGIDCKGGMELSLFERRLSALACSRTEALALLVALLDEARDRMAVCRRAGARSIWELPEHVRPVPVVLLVDELAELYLVDGSRVSRQEAAECSTALLRLGQLGAALGLHLVVAGQRIGSELGAGVTALRAQLGGRICHRVHDQQTAEMALGDLAEDAVVAAQVITEEEQGVAITTVGGTWTRVRSRLTTTADAREVVAQNVDKTPAIPALVRAMDAVNKEVGGND